MSDQRRLKNPVLLRDVRKQVGHLERSARDFDSGELDEAERLATTIRTLLHDTRTSTSVLTQYKVKDRLRFVDTMGTFRRENLGPELGAVLVTIDGPQIRFTPALDLDPNRLTCFNSFAVWWSRPVIRDVYGRSFCRRELILELVHKLGGAHLDEPTEKLFGLHTGESLGMSYLFNVPPTNKLNSLSLKIGGSNIPIEGGRFVDRLLETATRQFAYELVETLRPILAGQEIAASYDQQDLWSA